MAGNSFNDEERCVAAGYDNGDIKLFDLRKMSLRWETNVKNGVRAFCQPSLSILQRTPPVFFLPSFFSPVFFSLFAFFSSAFSFQVCSLEFDRKDILMNKLVAATLEAKYAVFDLRTHHPTRGYASLTEKVSPLTECLSAPLSLSQ